MPKILFVDDHPLQPLPYLVPNHYKTVNSFNELQNDERVIISMAYCHLFISNNVDYPSYLRYIASNKKSILILDESHEGELFLKTSDVLNKEYNQYGKYYKIHRCIEEYNIDPERVVFLSGNMNEERSYRTYVNSYPIKIFPAHYFWAIGYVNLVQKQRFPKIEHDLEKKDKLYLLYNRRMSNVRARMVYDLFINDYIKDGLVSFPKECPDYAMPMEELTNQLWQFPFHNRDRIDEWVETLPYEIDGRANEEKNFISQTLCANHYERTFISMVQESIRDQDKFQPHLTPLFITEKTFKAIAAGHPFMVFSNMNVLRSLKMHGFETFGDWIDESYDETDDVEEKHQIMMKNIQDLYSLTMDDWEEMYSIAEYNQDVFYNLDLEEFAKPIWNYVDRLLT